MSIIRDDLSSHIGMRLYFPEYNFTYEIEGYLPLEKGQTVTITEDTPFTSKYKTIDQEPPCGNYLVCEIDSPTLYRYNKYHKPHDEVNNWVRFSQRVTLVLTR
jgi:hypothetical protein